jgi:T5orf172 domain
MRIKFSEIENKVLPRVGIYEIYTENDIPLKIGISNNPKKRLSQHHASKDKYLRFIQDQDRSNPSNARSKQSILTKHFCYDKLITTEFKLEKTLDRKAFL